MFTIYIMR